jgi:hypothetical protein
VLLVRNSLEFDTHTTVAASQGICFIVMTAISAAFKTGLTTICHAGTASEMPETSRQHQQYY